MHKKLCLILMFLLSLPVFAGSFETAYESGTPVLLYIYSENCSYCHKFNPIFSGMAKTRTDYKFVKVDVNTRYGRELLTGFQGYYVPFIVLSSKKMHKSAAISPSCAINNICRENALKDFKS